jgi:hypothetical protein
MIDGKTLMLANLAAITKGDCDAVPLRCKRLRSFDGTRRPTMKEPISAFFASYLMYGVGFRDSSDCLLHIWEPINFFAPDLGPINVFSDLGFDPNRPLIGLCY